MRAGVSRWQWLPLAAALLLTISASAAEQPLAVVEAALHQYDGGPAAPASFEFVPGDTIFLTFRIAGFQTLEKDEEESFQLLYRIDALDPDGVPLKEQVEGASANQLAREDKKEKWMPLVRYDVLVPPAGPSGTYKIVVHLEDKLNGAKTEEEITFNVQGRDVEPAESVALRNFHFYRTESSMEPLPKPVYRAGDSVWVRFDITGYEFGEKNRFHVSYGIKVLRASGKLLFEQPVAAEEERESFYPERHIMGGLSLNLTPDLAAGEYTIIVTLQDRIAEAESAEEHVFLVE